MKRNIFKKKLIYLGGLASIAAPVAAVVSCGTSSSSAADKLKIKSLANIQDVLTDLKTDNVYTFEKMTDDEFNLKFDKEVISKIRDNLYAKGKENSELEKLLEWWDVSQKTNQKLKRDDLIRLSYSLMTTDFGVISSKNSADVDRTTLQVIDDLSGFFDKVKKNIPSYINFLTGLNQLIFGLIQTSNKANLPSKLREEDVKQTILNQFMFNKKLSAEVTKSLVVKLIPDDKKGELIINISIPIWNFNRSFKLDDFLTQEQYNENRIGINEEDLADVTKVLDQLENVAIPTIDTEGRLIIGTEKPLEIKNIEDEKIKDEEVTWKIKFPSEIPVPVDPDESSAPKATSYLTAGAVGEETASTRNNDEEDEYFKKTLILSFANFDIPKDTKVTYFFSEPNMDGEFKITFSIKKNDVAKVYIMNANIKGIQNTYVNSLFNSQSDKYEENEETKKREKTSDTSLEFDGIKSMLASDMSMSLSMLLLKEWIVLPYELQSLIDPNNISLSADDEKGEFVITVKKINDKKDEPFTFTFSGFIKTNEQNIQLKNYPLEYADITAVANDFKQNVVLSPLTGNDARNHIDRVLYKDRKEISLASLKTKFGISIPNPASSINKVKIEYFTSGAYEDGNFDIQLKITNLDNPSLFKIIKITNKITQLNDAIKDKFLNGLQINDTQMIIFDIPTNFDVANLNGRKVIFNADIKGVYENFKVDKLDNDWFKDNWNDLQNNEFTLPQDKPEEETNGPSTLIQYKTWLRKYWDNEAREKYNNTFLTNIKNWLITRTEFSEITKALKDSLEAKVAGMPESYREVYNYTFFENQLKWELIVDKLIEDNKLKPSSIEIENKIAELRRLASINGKTFQEYIAEKKITMDSIEKEFENELIRIWIFEQLTNRNNFWKTEKMEKYEK